VDAVRSVQLAEVVGGGFTGGGFTGGGTTGGGFTGGGLVGGGLVVVTTVQHGGRLVSGVDGVPVTVMVGGVVPVDGIEQHGGRSVSGVCVGPVTVTVGGVPPSTTVQHGGRLVSVDCVAPVTTISVVPLLEASLPVTVTVLEPPATVQHGGVFVSFDWFCPVTTISPPLLLELFVLPVTVTTGVAGGVYGTVTAGGVVTVVLVPVLPVTVTVLLPELPVTVVLEDPPEIEPELELPVWAVVEGGGVTTGVMTGVMTGGGVVTGTGTGAVTTIGGIAKVSAGEPKPKTVPAIAPAVMTAPIANTPVLTGCLARFWCALIVIVVVVERW
jgi:hypothetical protein